MTRVMTAAAGTLVAGAVLVGCASSDDVVADETEVAVAEGVTDVDGTPEVEVAEAEETDQVEMTRSQENAVKSAQTYLDLTSFSRSGLIEQLVFEDFSEDDATFAVDYLDPDWNAEAAEAAEAYLDATSFSRAGLIDQLEFDGFTAEQAEYGVDQAGLD